MDTAGWVLTSDNTPTIGPDTLYGTITVTHNGDVASLTDTVTATYGASKQSMLSMTLAPVINEVDYSIPHASGMDPNEFVALQSLAGVDRARRPARRLHA